MVCPLTIVLILVFCFSLLPVAMYQQQVLSNADAAGQMFSNILAQFAQQITPCTSAWNVLAKIINKVLIIVYALLGTFANAIGLSINGSAVFGWALNEHVAAYRQTRLKKEQVRDVYIANALKMYGVSRMDQLSLDHQYEIYHGALREMRAVPNQISLLSPSAFCGIVTGIGGFIDDFLDIFDTFILSFVQKIVSALAKAIKAIQDSQCTPSNTDTCLPDLIEIFVKLILDIILSTIPYGNCLNDIPMSIPRCMCSVIGVTNRVDVHLVGCMFKSNGCNITGYSNGFSAFIGCLDLKKLVKQIFGISSSTAAANENIAQAQIQIAELSALTQDLAISIEQLNELISPTSHLQVSDRYNMGHLVRLAEFREAKLLEIEEIRRNFTISQQIYFDYMNHTGNETVINSTTPEVSNKTYYEQFIDRSNTSDPAVQSVIELHDYFAANVELAPHGLTVIEVISHLADTTLKLWAMENLSIETAMHHYSKVPLHKGYWAAQQLAIHARENKKSNYTVTPMDSYHEVVSNYTQIAVDYTQFFTYSGITAETTMDQQEMKAHMNESLNNWKLRNAEILRLQNSRTMEANGLSVIITISGALSILLLGGSQIANVNCSSICGECCSQGLGCCSSCSSCILLLIGLVAFFGVNMVTNLLTNSTDNEDIISGLLKTIGDSLLDLYKKPPTNLQIITNFNDLGTAVQSSMDKIVIQAIRLVVKVSMFAIPILTLPEPESDDTVLSYVQGLILYPYFSPCTTDADCPGKGRCRLYGMPCGRDCTSAAPCLNPQGNCTVAPFLVENYCPENGVPTFNFILDFQCGSWGYNDEALTYTSNAVFQVDGWSWKFFITRDFWRFVWEILYAPILALMFVTRLVSTMKGVPALGLFTGLLQGFPIALPFGSLLPVLTVVSYFFLTPTQAVIHWLDSFFWYFGFWPFPWLQQFTRWPNWVDNPPYGSSTVSGWSCFVIHVPSTLIGLWLWINIFAIVAVLLFNPLSKKIYWVIWYLLVDFMTVLVGMCGFVSSTVVNRGSNDYL